MGATQTDLPLLQRREIEARIAAPLIRAFAAEVGQETALRVARQVMASLAREAGAGLRRAMGGDRLQDLARGVLQWSRGGALEMTVEEQTPRCFALRVTQCRFAQMYRELGLADLGYELSCARDFSLVEGFNPRIRLERTHTLMEDADSCDFRFTCEDG
ncbi:MAG: L-2-amino-thiazoline-4-carboxylic acid hydrolase [Candidatus Latescibacterota bacterium]